METVSNKKKIAPSKAQAATTPKPPAPAVKAKYVNPDFVALQIKAEGIADNFLGYLEKKMEDTNLNAQSCNALIAVRESVQMLHSIGLITSDRPEPEPIILVESTEGLRVATEEALSSGGE